ncbi:MAG: DUF4350 domain-containing protein [Thermoanaerobaculia bacterium]
MSFRGRERTVTLAVLAGVAGAVALAALVGGGGGAASSALSRSPEGWAAARRYVEARDVAVDLLDRPLAESSPGRGTLVVAFPRQRAAGLDPEEGVLRHLRSGGHLLLAYSGKLPGPAEEQILTALELGSVPARPEPPLAPLAWRRHVEAVWRLPPEEPAPAGAPLGGGSRARVRPGPLVLPAVDWRPGVPEGARILFRSPGGDPVAFAHHRGPSLVAVVPAAALANARLALGGNPDLLESLVASLPAPWSFDEYHHGLAARNPADPAAARQSRVLDLVLLQLVVLYGAALAALARRFGTPWREAPVVTGSTAAFFLGLGTLHHRLGHHAAAGRRLVERIRQLHPDLSLPPELLRRAGAVVDGPDLVELARRVARHRDRHSKGEPTRDP